jgi:hypothetical protein
MVVTIKIRDRFPVRKIDEPDRSELGDTGGGGRAKVIAIGPKESEDR